MKIQCLEDNKEFDLLDIEINEDMSSVINKHLDKTSSINNPFYNYTDGIYEITVDQYKKFYNSKRLYIKFNRNINILYMIKKHGYYCFIHKSKRGKLSMLNGGNLKGLKHKDLEYYFNNMDKVIDLISKPMKAYTAAQKSIAKEIRKLGGLGYIHGCIIDIDFWNHVYVNPLDGTITGYCFLPHMR